MIIFREYPIHENPIATRLFSHAKYDAMTLNMDIQNFDAIPKNRGQNFIPKRFSFIIKLVQSMIDACIAKRQLKHQQHLNPYEHCPIQMERATDLLQIQHLCPIISSICWRKFEVNRNWQLYYTRYKFQVYRSQHINSIHQASPIKTVLISTVILLNRRVNGN